MFEKIIEMFDALFIVNDDAASVRKWRRLIALLIVAFTVHVAWACSWIPYLDGFALKSDFTSAQSSMIQQMSSLKTAVIDGQTRMTYSELQSELRRIKQDKFNLQYNKETQPDKNASRVEKFYAERMESLNDDEYNINRKINALLSAHPELDQ